MSVLRQELIQVAGIHTFGAEVSGLIITDDYKQMQLQLVTMTLQKHVGLFTGMEVNRLLLYPLPIHYQLFIIIVLTVIVFVHPASTAS